MNENPRFPTARRWLFSFFLLTLCISGLGGLSLARADLLGVAPVGYPLVTNVGRPGDMSYDAATGRLSVTASPQLIFAKLGFPPGAIQDTRNFSIEIVLNSAGSVAGGNPGGPPDLEVVGNIPFSPFVPGSPYSGVLLTGNIVDFGFLNQSGTTDKFDFRFTLTGGALTSGPLAPAFAGMDLGVSLDLEQSTFDGSFRTGFTGLPKPNVGPIPGQPPEPEIELLKQVSLTGGEPFFDADTPASAPIGALGADATYRLIVRNIGTEVLIDAVINDPTLGLVNVTVPGGPLNPGDERVIDSGDTGFANLHVANRCDSVGNKPNISTVDAEGQGSGKPVSDDNPANVNCRQGPAIELIKQVSLTGGGPFFDADTPATAPIGALGADATYRLIVRNVGDEVLVNTRISDPVLGLVNVPVPGGPMNPGDERVIDSGDAGFGALFFADRCDSIGNKTNIATVNAQGEGTGTPVSDDNPANVACESPKIELLKQVSLTGGAPFFDADTPATAPIGALGADATYRLIVRNIGTEVLIDATISDPTLGLVNVAVPGGPLNPGDERIIGSGDAGFSNLDVADRCDSIGNKPNIATVNAEGETSGEPVSDDNPANVNCIQGPAIELLKQVSLTGGAPFFDADTPATAPVGILGADATYRLIVRNVGDEVLVNATITDPTLGLANVPVPGGPLSPGDERVIDSGNAGFSPLFFADRCDSIGNKTNNATVDAQGEATGTPVSDDNPANVNCEAPECSLKVTKTCVVDGVPEPGLEACSVTHRVPSCITVGGVITKLTFKYTGGPCPGDHEQLGLVDCMGGIDPNKPVDIVLPSGYWASPPTVRPGETFMLTYGGTQGFRSRVGIDLTQPPRDLQWVGLITNCLVPLKVGDVFGALTLVGINGQTDGGVPVKYNYLVENTGMVGVDLTQVLDDKLGELLDPAPQFLAAGDTLPLSKSTEILGDTTNQVLVHGVAGANRCTASDTATVEIKEPPVCDIAGAAPTLTMNDSWDYRLTWPLSNLGGEPATIRSIAATWPDDISFLMHVSLDGHQLTSAWLPGSGATIGYFVGDIADRQIAAGETGNLVFDFTRSIHPGSAAPSDFSIKVDFWQGCTISTP